MSYPLDVNLVTALLWENHECHQRARQRLRGVPSFATCPLVQLGFAQISSHPIPGYGMGPEQAFGVLRQRLANERRRFVADDFSGGDRALLTESISTPHHLTDHHLVALAHQPHLSLATIDAASSRAFGTRPGLVTLAP